MSQKIMSPKAIIVSNTNSGSVITKKTLDKKQLEITMSIIKYNNKICKLILYNIAINNLIYGQC